MTLLEDFLNIFSSLSSVTPLISDITKGEISFDKSEVILIKTRKKFKKEHHLLVTPLKTCMYDFKDIRPLKSKLQELKEAKDEGLITAEEYEQLRKQLLNQT